MKFSCSPLCIMCLLTVPVLVTATAVGADQVTRRSDGSGIRGALETLSRTQIVIRRSNDEVVTISPDDIRDIRFDREPPALQTARSNERSGEYSAAIKQLQEVQADYSGNDQRVITEMEFLIARCQARQGLTDSATVQTAMNSLKSFLLKHGNSYRALEATLWQARLLALTDASRAAGLLEQLRASGVDGFVLQAGVILGHALLEEGKADQALTTFDDVIRVSQGKPLVSATHYDSRIGRAVCLQKLTRINEALETLEAVIADAPDEQQDTLAKAWNRVGDCQRDHEEPKAALLAYLHVDILYSEVAEAHAKALYHLIALWETTGHPDRARDARARLQEAYSGSRWAQELSN